MASLAADEESGAVSSRPFVKLPSEVEVAYLVETLKECSGHGQFPVLHGDQFIGMISQSDLLVLLSHKGLFYESSGQGGPRRCITHSELRKIYPITLSFEEVVSSLTEEDKSRYLDLHHTCRSHHTRLKHMEVQRGPMSCIAPLAFDLSLLLITMHGPLVRLGGVIFILSKRKSQS